jgi:hypothetical protein
MMQGYTTKEPIMADETKPNISVDPNQLSNKIKPIDLPEIKPLETQSVPKKQSLKEWAMAGGGVPAQYKGREHVWHKQVQKYAAGGEVFNTVPDMSDGGQINEGPAFSKGGAVKQAVKDALEGVAEGVKPLVDRINMHFKDVTKRVPELQEGAQKIQGGEMTPAEYEKLVKKYKPVKPYEFIPKPATRDEAINALTADKRDLYGTPSSMLKAGDPVGLRLDIPAYSDHGVWVPAVHRQAAGFGAGDRVGYESVAGVMNPTFGMSEKAALSIAAGKPKGTIATIKGEWNPTDEATAVARAQEYLNNPEWVQVGMDPERHGYFYDRRTMKPITAAEEAIQVGPLVLAKKPQYGNKKDFKYAEGGEVHMEDGGAAFGVFPQMKPKRSKQDPDAAKNAPLDFLRGRIAGTLGMPGDIESLVRIPYDYFRNPTMPELVTGDKTSKTFFPTSEDIEQRLPFRSDAPVSRAAAGLGSLTANPMDLVRAGKVATQAAKAAKPVVGQALEDYMFKQGLAMPAVEPKKGKAAKANEAEMRSDIAGLKARGMDVPGVDFADPNAPPTMRMSEALGISGSEGKFLNFTEADRSRVFGPNRGGVGFSALQHYSEPHKNANTVWGFGNKSVTEKKINQNDPDNTVWTTYAGSPEQHKSNTVVVKDAVKTLQDANAKGSVHPEQIRLINERIRQATSDKGTPLFSDDFDITDPQALSYATTFDRRAAISDALMGTGVKKPMISKEFKQANPGVKWSDASNIGGILTRETDPVLVGANTFDVGPHLFTMDNGIIYRPDLNEAFPFQVTGSDLGLRFNPAPFRIAAPDFINKKGYGPNDPINAWALSRGVPRQFISEKYLTGLQKQNHKAGGAIGGLSQATKG